MKHKHSHSLKGRDQRARQQLTGSVFMLLLVLKGKVSCVFSLVDCEDKERSCSRAMDKERNWERGRVEAVDKRVIGEAHAHN